MADPAKGSRHNRGCAVDLTLYRLADGRAGRDAEPLRRDDRARVPGLGRRDRRRRAACATSCAPRWSSEGFTVFESEWWHFDYRDWREYPILNVPFDAIGK